MLKRTAAISIKARSSSLFISAHHPIYCLSCCQICINLSSPLIRSVCKSCSFYHFSIIPALHSLLFPLFALSSPVLSQLFCPLPRSLLNCCNPTLPSDREGWAGAWVCVCVFCMLCRSWTSNIVHVCGGVCTYLLFWMYLHACFLLACAK